LKTAFQTSLPLPPFRFRSPLRRLSFKNLQAFFTLLCFPQDCWHMFLPIFFFESITVLHVCCSTFPTQLSPLIHHPPQGLCLHLGFVVFFRSFSLRYPRLAPRVLLLLYEPFFMDISSLPPLFPRLSLLPSFPTLERLPDSCLLPPLVLFYFRSVEALAATAKPVRPPVSFLRPFGTCPHHPASFLFPLGCSSQVINLSD